MLNNIQDRIEAMDKGLLSVEQIRDLAADLGKAEQPRAEETLLALLGNEDPIVRYNAIFAVGLDLSYRTAAPLLKAIAMNDVDPDCRGASIAALGNMFQNTRDREVLSVVGFVALHDVDEGVRRSAYKATLIVYGVSREEHLAVLQDQMLEVDKTKIDMMISSS